VPLAALFPGIELARRVERAECGLLESAVTAAARRDPARGARALEVAGGIAGFAGPSSPVNKVAGVGFAGELSESGLESVERFFLDRDLPVRFEVSNLADPSVGALLTRRGYILSGFENVLGLQLDGRRDGKTPPAITVLPSPAEELEAWLDLVITGFAHPDDQGIPSDEEFPRQALEKAFRDFDGAEGFVRYLARRDGVPAGGAGLRTGGGVALLCGAATLPEHRRRGVQSAMLAVRLAQAGAAGCDLAVVTTQPGSKSQENVQRQGFQLLYTRAVLIRSASSGMNPASADPGEDRGRTEGGR
jgi:GNAT superfamily N-acetyltransferase